MGERDNGESGSIKVKPQIFVAERYPSDGRKAFSLENFGFPGHYLVHNAPDVYIPPVRHQNSDALYFIDYYEGNNRILVSHLPPHSHSSRHYHNPPIIEYYWLLKGELYLGERPVTPVGLVIYPGKIHQIETKEEGALLLILMENARSVPQDSQHLYFLPTGGSDEEI